MAASFLDSDPTLISWSRGLRADAVKGKSLGFSGDRITKATYRPFTKQWMYFDRRLNEMVLQMPRLFPSSEAENLIITFKERWSGDGQFALITDAILEQQTDGGAQCFPLYLYDEASQQAGSDLFASEQCMGLRRRYAITDEGLAHFTNIYPNEAISEEDLFYYVYGILHSPDYRERYADNLSKELPRIPRVRTAADFWDFCKAGRELAAFHLNYETTDKYPLTIETKGPLPELDYRVEKMRFAKKKDPETGKSVNDRSIVIYNDKITMRGIPEAAWDYIVNGKAALDWVMERQAVRVDKASGIVNDANDWATETMGNPKYPLELFQRVVTVSLETQRIVNALPALDIHPADMGGPRE